MRIKYLVIIAVLTTAIFGFGAPSAVQGITIDELRAQIAQLQAQLQALLAQQGGGTAWCHTFNKNLKIGDTGSEIDNLWTALGKDDANVGQSLSLDHEGMGQLSTFGENTAATVVGFQEKYASEILTPSKLRRGTGYVGPATRAKLNALYGCGTKQECKTDADCPIINCLAAPCPANKCENGKCVTTTTNTCTKSDSKNYYVKGDLKSILNDGSKYNQTDYCSGNYIYEWYCDGVNPRIDQSYVCPNGCGNGACKPSTQLFNITFPSAGAKLVQGLTYNFTWTGVDNGVVSYTVVLAGTDFTKIIGTAYPSVGSFVWTVPSDINPGNYKVEFNGYRPGGTDVPGDSSDLFTIISSTQPSITVTSPNGGEQWQKGNTYTITWTSQGLDPNLPAGIVLTDYSGAFGAAYDVANYATPAGPKIGDGRFTIILDTTGATGSSPLGSKYKVLVSAGPTQTSIPVMDESNDYFSIVAQGTLPPGCTSTSGYSPITGQSCASSTQPSITVTSPNGGETWKVGETHDITWTSSGIDNVAIGIFGYDSAGTRKNPGTIYGGASAAGGKYSWTIPSDYAIFANKERVKIYLLGYGANVPIATSTIHDFSDNYFSIAPAQTALNISENQIASISGALEKIAEAIKNLLGQ